MNIIEQISVKNSSDMIYAKTTLRNLLKKEKRTYDETFLIFALMELSTNLIKHGGGGEVWILKSENEILLAALDYGKGIKDVAFSMQKGTTSMQNSLGLGLYQINNNDDYHLEIFTLTKESLHGTIVLVSPRKFFKSILSLQINYIGERLCGDMVATKGKFALLADGSGHGRKANKSVEFVKSFFYENHFSCLLIDEFFQSLHEKIIEKGLRGVVLSLLEITKEEIQVCGVGNISLWYKEEKETHLITQKNGIIGEAFSSSDKKSFSLTRGEKLIATTDGIDDSRMQKVISQVSNDTSSALLALVLMHFASVEFDDKTIVVIENSKKERE